MSHVYVPHDVITCSEVEGGKRKLEVESVLGDGYVRAVGINKFGRTDSFILPDSAITLVPKVVAEAPKVEAPTVSAGTTKAVPPTVTK